MDAGPGQAASAERNLLQASRLLAADAEKAEALARAALENKPGDPRALGVLGAALRRQNDLAAAIDVLGPLATSASASWVVLFELAQAHIALGQSRAAMAPLRRALELNPGLTIGWRKLGDIQFVAGDFAGARDAYDRRVRSMIRDRHMLAAADALMAGRLIEAERVSRSLLAARPVVASAAEHLLGEALRRRGGLSDAVVILRRCLEKAPEFYQARQSLAQALFGMRRFTESLLEFNRLLARDPEDVRSLMMKATALTEMGGHDQAVEATAAVVTSFPDQPRAWLMHGHCLRTIGRGEEAVEAYRKCIELDPAFTAAYWGLANLKTFRFTARQRDAMEAVLTRKDLSPKGRVELHFALGKAFEDERGYAEAFDHYGRANALEEGERPYDPEETTARMAKSQALFSKAFFAERSGWGSHDASPIFIVGLPRSGSTLVDQILASHPMVEGTRELPDLPIMAAGVRGYPESLSALPPETFAKLGREFLRRAQPHRRLGRPRFTDKTPSNFFHAGLIQLILPNAKIIDVRRHPLGCCLSAFRQHFAAGFECAFDLGHLGRYYADYVAFMAHFDRVLPGKIHRVIYEDLVASTETEVRRLLAYLDLPFDAACMRHFDNPRPVTTPSSEQVRQPIFTDALDQWRHFEPWLDPLKAALGPALAAYPAAPPPRNHSMG